MFFLWNFSKKFLLLRTFLTNRKRKMFFLVFLSQKIGSGFRMEVCQNYFRVPSKGENWKKIKNRVTRPLGTLLSMSVPMEGFEPTLHKGTWS